MFQLDDQFLADIGLGDLPEDQKKPFLQHIYTQLQEKVGFRLSEGLSDEQLSEFELIIDANARPEPGMTEQELARLQQLVAAGREKVEQWIAQYVPDYQNDELLQRMSQQTRLAVDDPSLKAEYAATKWLEVNRPDYKDVVATTLDELKQEIIQNRDAILGTN